MTTLTVEVQNSGDANKIAAALRMMRSVKKIVVQEDEFERIPGLPYTREERIASVRLAMEDVRAGRVVSSEELKKRMEAW